MHANYQLPASPVPLIKLIAQQSGCFRVVDRAAGLRSTMQEQELKEAGILRQNSGVGWSNTNEGKVIAAAFFDAHNKLVGQVQQLLAKDLPPPVPVKR